MMLLTAFRNRLNPSNCRSFLSVKEFSAALDQEIARAHRYDHEFSLLVFDEMDVKYIQTLKSVLCQRIRSTDQVGWLDERRMGIILPHTSAEGAWRVAADICREAATAGAIPICKVRSFNPARKPFT